MRSIYIGADHRGFSVKEKLVEYLRENDYNVTDLSTEFIDDDDYTDSAINVAEKVVLENTKGVVICGSGVGAAIAANKVKGARAGLCLSEKQTRAARNDDDINILCLSADMVSEEENLKITKTFLETVFGSEEKYIRRINKIKAYESKIC